MDPEGGMIGYNDGHVAYIKEPDFSEIIGGLRTEDGQPFAPHEDPNTLETVNSIGLLLEATAELEGARERFEQALEG
ncbi:MAG: hypothetical protein AAGI53_06965 [Planctomycetota bacterium]